MGFFCKIIYYSKYALKAIVLPSLLLLSVQKSVAQNEKDSTSLKTDIEAIRKGREIKRPKHRSVVRSRVPEARVDTAALRPGNLSPTPPSPNLPNPHEPVPSVINAEPPATPPAHPPTPPGMPTGTGGRSKRNR